MNASLIKRKEKKERSKLSLAAFLFGYWIVPFFFSPSFLHTHWSQKFESIDQQQLLAASLKNL